MKRGCALGLVAWLSVVPLALTGQAPQVGAAEPSRSAGVGLLAGGAQCTGAVIRVWCSVSPSPRWVALGWLAKPTACSAA